MGGGSRFLHSAVNFINLFFFFLEIVLHFYAPSFSWSFLEVTSSSRYNDSIQAYAAGAVEAAATSPVSLTLIWSDVKIFLV